MAKTFKGRTSSQSSALAQESKAKGVKMIARVHHMLEDTVMVFNEKGKVVLQGKFETVIDEIKRDSNGSTKFYVVGLMLPVNRDLFFSKDYWKFIKNRRL